MQKKIIIRLFLCAEVAVFGWFYYYGARGYLSVQELKRENIDITHHIAELQQEIEDVDRQIVAWSTDPFFKEKIAREQLQMARADDVIYLVE